MTAHIQARLRSIKLGALSPLPPSLDYKCYLYILPVSFLRSSLSANVGAAGSCLRRLHLYDIPTPTIDGEEIDLILVVCPSLVDLEIVHLPLLTLERCELAACILESQHISTCETPTMQCNKDCKGRSEPVICQ